MLSVIEAKIARGIIVAQDVLYMYSVLELLELKVEPPMVLDTDNSTSR
jgi:hypothetical protein